MPMLTTGTGVYRAIGGGAGMAYDASSAGGLNHFATASSASWSHPGVTPTAVALFIANDNSFATISTITYGGVSLTLQTTYAGITFPNGNSAVTLWGVASGSLPTGTQTVVVTGSTTGMGFGAIVHTVSGSNISTVFDSVGTAIFNNGSATPSVSITSTSGDIVVDALFDANNITATANGGQTQVISNVTLPGSPVLGNASWKAATTASTSMGYSTADAFSYCLVGASFKQ